MASGLSLITYPEFIGNTERVYFASRKCIGPAYRAQPVPQGGGFILARPNLFALTPDNQFLKQSDLAPAVLSVSSYFDASALGGTGSVAQTVCNDLNTGSTINGVPMLPTGQSLISNPPYRVEVR
jgi:hypothetical protein